jgi:hypothetical protein
MSGENSARAVGGIYFTPEERAVLVIEEMFAARVRATVDGSTQPKPIVTVCFEHLFCLLE